MAQTVYNIAKSRMASGDLDLNTDTLGMLLLKTTAAGAFNPDVDDIAELLAVATVAECDFTNYVRKTFVGTVTVDNTNDRANIDAANVTWTTAGGALNNTPVAAVIYEELGVDSADIPIAYYDTNFGSVATNGGDFTVNITDFLRVA